MFSFIEFQECVKSDIQEYFSPDFGECSVRVISMQKQNDCTLHGLVCKKEGIAHSPIVYLDQCYNEYCSGRELSSVMQSIADSVEKAFENFSLGGIDVPLSFESVKDNIVIMLANTERNKEYLEGKSCRPFCDLSIYYRILFNADDTDLLASAVVTDRLMNTWGIDEEQLYNLALKNSKRLLPAQAIPMADIVRGMIPFTDVDIPMIVVTNDRRSHGASAIVYSGVLDTIVNKLDSDLVILPSSIHEVIVIPFPTDGDTFSLKSMVASVNKECVSDSEFLSNSVYVYNRSTKTYSII